jgi:redox-sensing transcriptional repressor
MANTPERPDSPFEGPVPRAVVSRLSLYLRELQQLVRDGDATISSNQLGSRLGLTDAQIRKDLAYFGQFGYPGIGYRCEELIGAIRGILGTDHDWAVGIIGAGNLGSALIRHRGFSKQGFRIVAAFDTATEKVGKVIDGVLVRPMDQLAETVQREQIMLGILAVPAAEAQTVAGQLVAAGVAGILNFAPVTISVPVTVSKASVDLAIELEQLSFDVVNRSKKN